MNHQVPVSVLHRVAHREEQLDTSLDRAPVLLHVAVDRDAFDVLQGEPGEPLGSDPAVQQAGDPGMLQGGEDLPLFDEAAHQVVVTRDRAADQLEGDALVVGLIALGEVDGAHSTVPCLAEDPVWTDASAFGRTSLIALVHQRGRIGRCLPVEPGLRLLTGRQEPLHVLAERSVLCAGLFQKGATFFGRALHGEIE